MMQRINCLVHGNFTTERSAGAYCPRCADMERKSQTDLKTERPSFAQLANLVVEECAPLLETLKEDKVDTHTVNKGFKEYSQLIYKDYKKQEGHKDDQAKPDLSLLPREALEATAKAFMHGEVKYGRYNYLQGMDWHRVLAAVLRHITAFNDGEDKDPESGLSHLAHASAAISMLLVYEVRRLGKDTRHGK